MDSTDGRLGLRYKYAADSPIMAKPVPATNNCKRMMIGFLNACFMCQLGRFVAGLSL